MTAQKTIVRGSVRDAETGKTLPFANIVFLHSVVGTISDIEGIFYLETTNATDTLIVSSLGYESYRTAIRKGSEYELHLELQPTSLSIEEVVVTPGENPAFRILRKIEENKARNNPDRFSSYQYKSYNKLQLDINNIDDNFKKQPLFKQFQFAFDYMDSSEVFGKNYLPILISESVTNYYYRKEPKLEKETIDAFKISGIQNNTISQYSGKMYQKLNIYDNFMHLFEPGFVSPIADFGKLYYKYYLEDSAYIDNSWCYKISFKPKRKLERTFYGYFWVADTSFAIKKVQLRVSKTVNINFLNDLIAINEYSKINDSTWFLTNEDLLLDFYISDKVTGFFGRKTSFYEDIVINQSIPDSIAELRTDTYMNDEDIMKDSVFWQENRKAELSKEEKGIYEMVDSIMEVPAYKRIYGLVEMLVDYYLVLGPVEAGPYYTIYSYNPIEGHRFRLGGRTSNNFSTKVRFSGHLAYGTKDERFKYGLGAEYMFSRNPRISTGMFYYHDIRQLGKSENAFLDDNFFASILRRRPNYKLTMVDQYNFYFEREWFQGFSNTIALKHQIIYPTEYVPFQVIGEDGTTTPAEQLTSFDITLHTHFAYREKFLLGKFERKSLGSKYPVLDLQLTYGPKGLLTSDYEYFKAELKITDKIEVNPVGYLRYHVSGGKIFGTLPYPLLELHPGNETYAFDPLAFNMMNYYEFVSDQYLIFSAEHHFQGFFFNRIPLFRWLKFREVVTGKLLLGSLSEKNLSVVEFPEGLTYLEKPYSEVGIGIENILRFFRVDAMWRLSYLDHENTQTFGLRATMQLTF
ncbi:MAG: DUF5686 family protein [Bacteroidales bacterium]